MDVTTFDQAFLILRAEIAEDFYLDVNQVTPDLRMKEDLGMDSLDISFFATVLEIYTGRSVPDSRAWSAGTLGDLVRIAIPRQCGE